MSLARQDCTLRDDEYKRRHRWVEYAEKSRYNASQVPPEWHGWLHYITDHTGDELLMLKPKRYGVDHKENLSGEGEEYIYHSKGHALNPGQKDWTRYQSWEPTKTKAAEINLATLASAASVLVLKTFGREMYDSCSAHVNAAPIRSTNKRVHYSVPRIHFALPILVDRFYSKSMRIRAFKCN
ncbi:unnamed protein product [Dovyalis caffra]|uniref:NADH dehydrogenase [ubiquinone] 1 alpha subcomplex subunit 12 n=1 Tax=Dovyalis caffra TaxID=77055 RepID=A0AAV1RXB4_9ROSI|nr:unnamed protein product [Dovyalis caffra]